MAVTHVKKKKKKRYILCVCVLTEQGGILGALTARPGSHLHSTQTGGSPWHTSHRGRRATCVGSSQMHWVLGLTLWVTEIEKRGVL